MVRDTGGVKNEKRTMRKLDLATGDEQKRSKWRQSCLSSKRISGNVRVLIRSSDAIGHAIAERMEDT